MSETVSVIYHTSYEAGHHKVGAMTVVEDRDQAMEEYARAIEELIEKRDYHHNVGLMRARFVRAK